MINPKNNDEKNDVTIVGTDFFTDSESFLNELTDDELQEVRGGEGGDIGVQGSWISLFFCNNNNRPKEDAIQ